MPLPHPDESRRLVKRYNKTLRRHEKMQRAERFHLYAKPLGPVLTGSALLAGVLLGRLLG